MEKEPQKVKADAGLTEGIDPAQEAINRYLGSMEVGQSRTLGIEDFRNLMHAVHAEFITADDEELSGAIKGDKKEFTYTCGGSDCKVTRVE